MSDRAKTEEITSRLIAQNADKLCVTELPFDGFRRRIDVWTVAPIASKKYEAIAYEVKVSRSDFKNDSEEKQRFALRYSDRFFYVTPPSLLQKDEVPTWAGLIELHGAEFKVIKQSPRREKQAPDWALFVEAVRNASNVRRDTELMRRENSMLRDALKRAQSDLSMHQDRMWKMQMEKFEAQKSA